MRKGRTGGSALVFALFTLAAIGQGCRPGPAVPEPIRPAEDTCASCRMQVSQLRYAAEIVTPDGEALKFDDVGCFRAYRTAHPELRDAPAWVVDSETGGWLKARSAAYLLDAPDRTPMGFGIVAFSSAERAKIRGSRVATFDEMMAAGQGGGQR
jgi:copper chaperone NosL